MIFNKYPYTDFHEMNLDWIIYIVKKLEHEFTEFKVLNTLTFGGEWSISKYYKKWTIVDYKGFGYVSIKNVPEGIDIENSDYWVMVADYSSIYNDFKLRIEALESYYVTPEQFGAKGDGLTDDSSAFQAAVDTGKPVCIKQIPGVSYRIANTVKCPTKTKLFSLTPPHCFYPNLNGGGIFVDCAIGFELDDYCTVENLNLYQTNNVTNTYFVSKSNDPDNFNGSECRINNCTFVNGLYGLVSQGRGDVVENCYFGVMVAGVRIEYPSTEAEGNAYQKINTGGRGWLISGNKFHACSYVIDLGAGYLNNVVITGNVSDISRTFIKVRSDVTLQSSSIVGNSALYLREQFIDCLNGSTFKNVIISGNSGETNITGEGALDGQMTIAIKLSATTTHENISITGNVFKGCSSFVLALRNIKNSSVVGNTFVDFTGSNYILVSGSIENLNITGNSFNSVTYVGTILHGIETPILSGSVILANVHNATIANDILTTGDKANTIQNY